MLRDVSDEEADVWMAGGHQRCTTDFEAMGTWSVLMPVRCGDCGVLEVLLSPC